MSSQETKWIKYARHVQTGYDASFFFQPGGRLYIIYEMEHKLVKLCEMTVRTGVLIRALEVRSCAGPGRGLIEFQCRFQATEFSLKVAHV
jgi:hypothetical protein